jgi:hypothetical protein
MCAFVAVPELDGGGNGAADVSPLAMEVARAARAQAARLLPEYMLPK